jgi:hypothetical protein
MLTEWTAESGSLRPEGAFDCVLSVTKRLVSKVTTRTVKRTYKFRTANKTFSHCAFSFLGTPSSVEPSFEKRCSNAPTSCLSLYRFRRVRDVSHTKRYGSDNITHNALDIRNMRLQIHIDIALKLTDNRTYHSQRARRSVVGIIQNTYNQNAFIVPTDAHYYKIAERLKHLKLWHLLQHVSVHAGTIIREQSCA